MPKQRQKGGGGGGKKSFATPRHEQNDIKDKTTIDKSDGVRFGAAIDNNSFDDNSLFYSSSNKTDSQYVSEIIDDEDDDDYNAGSINDSANSDVSTTADIVDNSIVHDSGRVSYHPSTLAASNNTAGNNAMDHDDDNDNPFADTASSIKNRISNRENDYQKRRFDRVVFEEGTSFKDAMKQTLIEKEKIELIQELQKQQTEEGEQQRNQETDGVQEQQLQPNIDKDDSDPTSQQQPPGPRRKRRWDSSASEDPSQTNPSITTTTASVVDAAEITDNESVSSSAAGSKLSVSARTGTQNREWDDDTSTTSLSATAGSTKRRKRWDETPVIMNTSAPSFSDTPLVVSGRSNGSTSSSTSKWDETPVMTRGNNQSIGDTPLAISKTSGSRWDATPLPAGMVPNDGSATPSSASTMAGNLTKAAALEREMESRNRPWTDSALDAILPAEGYAIIQPPSNYMPLRTPGRQLLATPTPLVMTPAGFQMELPIEQRQDSTIQEIREAYGVPLGGGNETDEGKAGSSLSAAANLPSIKPEDVQYFGRLLEDADEDKLSSDELKERQIMSLLLKIKSGTPPQRKTAMRQITDKARTYGAGPLFNQILPLLMSPTLEDQERHLLVKVVDRVLYKLDDLVRPYVHRILAVIEPLLIDEDYYARVEGREIISNLAKAAGLATMIATMRPDIDSPDEHVRNTTSRAFAVVASALGLPALLPFLKAVCQSRKSWQARHTGIKIVQQIALLIGVAVLPYLQELVDIISHGLTDEQQKVKIITALTCAALAEAAYPYGIESFDSVIRPLWKGAMEQHTKALAAFLKAIGFVIPLMEENYASHYTKLVMPILLREFHSPDEEMKRIVLKVIQQCVATAGVEPDYIRNEILPEFFKNFWIRRMALDRRNYNQVIETTEELANKVGSSDILMRVVNDLKDDSEPYRRMVMETIKRVLSNLGASDIDERLEEQLIDGMLYAFQEQAIVASNVNVTNNNGQIMLDGFGTVVNALGLRCKPYLKQIAGTIKWRLNNKAAYVRMQAADLIGRIALVMKACDEDQLMGHLGVVLYEYLGEEYPEVLGSILGALRAIVNVIGMTRMTPPIRELLPRLTPILRNRHEKVQESVIDLVGRIADRGHEYVSAKEWMRICFELLEMVRAHKKAIRRAAVSTFGFIAKAIGPQDVLHTLLNNLKVQDRQMRVCTTVAIAIVAEICGPFTVLPALMNEYRVPELNVQNGVLKALSFMFEYIGSMGKDYAYAVAPMLVDALMERDPVHRQTACAAVKHLALGVAGHGCEDALIHILNYVWPNLFEESPHVIQAVFDAIQGLMVALGPGILLQYTLQGLYHPSRAVRTAYWRVYNCLYIYNSDALVALYPVIEDDEYNTYARTSLELFI